MRKKYLPEFDYKSFGQHDSHLSLFSQNKTQQIFTMNKHSGRSITFP